MQVADTLDSLADWPDREAAALARDGAAAPSGRDPRAIALRLMLAAVRGDDAALAAARAEARAHDRLPDLAFLADWAAYWCGAAPEPAPAPRPARREWQGDADWLAWRRALEPHVARARTGEVPIAAGAGPLLCEVAVNGRAFRAILDTGAPSSLVSAELADAAGLSVEAGLRDLHDGSGKAMRGGRTVIGEIALGSWRGAGLPAEVISLAPALGVQAILSPFELFGAAGFGLDLGAGRLVVGEAAPDPAAIALPLLRSEGVASVLARVNGVRALMLLDTGAGALVLGQGLARRSGAAPAGGAGIVSPTAFAAVGVQRLGAVRVAVPGLPELALPGYAKPDPPHRPRPLPRLRDGHLGIDWFRRHRVRFPARRDSVLIAPAEDAP